MALSTRARGSASTSASRMQSASRNAKTRENGRTALTLGRNTSWECSEACTRGLAVRQDPLCTAFFRRPSWLFRCNMLREPLRESPCRC
eukprot:4825586-Prymnesium_polylepis.1